MKTFNRDNAAQVRSDIRFDGYNPYETSYQWLAGLEHYAYTAELNSRGPRGEFDANKGLQS